MEFTMKVPRMFNIDIEQFETYLFANGWKRDLEYNNNMSRFTLIKDYNIHIVLPGEDSESVYKEIYLMSAVETLAQYMNDDIESVIESINTYR